MNTECAVIAVLKQFYITMAFSPCNNNQKAKVILLYMKPEKLTSYTVELCL